jgi:hypothetical protein
MKIYRNKFFETRGASCLQPFGQYEADYYHVSLCCVNPSESFKQVSQEITIKVRPNDLLLSNPSSNLNSLRFNWRNHQGKIFVTIENQNTPVNKILDRKIVPSDLNFNL